MTLFYNWDLIKKNSIKEIIAYLHYKHYRQAKDKYTWPAVCSIMHKGRKSYNDCFILYPNRLLGNVQRQKPLYIYQYLELAALRNYVDYKLMGESSLPVAYATANGYTVEQLVNNYLITIRDDKIHFKYED